MYHPTSTSIVALIALTRTVCASPVPSRPRPHSFDLPLTWNEFGFLGNISLGTPPQPITSFVDWTWISQYVFTEKSCHDDEARLSECFAKEQTVFNQSQSSTFQDQSASYPSRTWNPNHVCCPESLIKLPPLRCCVVLCLKLLEIFLTIPAMSFESSSQNTYPGAETLTAKSPIVLLLRRSYRRLCLGGRNSWS